MSPILPFFIDKRGRVRFIKEMLLIIKLLGFLTTSKRFFIFGNNMI